MAKVIMTALAAAFVISIGGCSTHHEETPQQKFVDALSHNNAAEASQIWLHMSPDQRLQFQRGQGVHPMSSPKQVQQQVIQRAMEHEAGGQESAGGSEAQPATLGTELRSLPNYQPQSSPPAGQ